jgi:sugar/nucleoside kinase (ribokinase family)
MSASYDVLGLGCVAVDDLLFVEHYPPADAKVPVRHRERQCGGLTATALVAAARLGARAAFAGILGDDDDSRFVVDSLRREGIDLGQLLFRPGVRPIHSTVIVDETRRTRTILHDLTGAAGADPTVPPDEVIRSTRVLFVDQFGVEGMTRAARVARAAGIPVVADFERGDWPGFAELLALVDHLIVSRHFAARHTGTTDPAGAAGALWTAARQVVVVTCGEEGCWYVSGEEPSRPRHHPAFAVSAVDTTGCGDVFHGAYAAGLAEGLDLVARIRVASAAAALKTLRPGGQAGIPTRAGVEAFLREARGAGL